MSLVALIESTYKELNYDKGFKNAASFHLSVLLELMHKEILTSEEKDQIKVAKYFFEHIHLFPANKDIHFSADEGNPALFAEIFMQNLQNAPNSEILEAVNYARKGEFYLGIKIGDVLLLRVKNVLDVSYELTVLSKVNLHRKIDDLDLCAILYKSGVPEFKKNECIRGVFIKAVESSASAESSNSSVHHPLLMVVSLDTKQIRDGVKVAHLGSIPEDEIPNYSLNPNRCVSLSEYLNCDSKLFNYCYAPYWAKKMEENGLNPYCIYSFSEERDGQKYENLGENILKDIIEKEFRNSIIDATDYAKAKDFKSAVDCLDNALRAKPMSADTYQTRAERYLKLDKEKPFRAILDWEKALEINSNLSLPQKRISDVLYKSARKFRKHKEYRKALEAVEAAIQVNELNEDAKHFRIQLTKRHSELLTGLKRIKVDYDEKI